MRKKKRRFRYLLYKHVGKLSFHEREGFNLETNQIYLSEHTPTHRKKEMEEINEFYQLADELGIDDEILKLVIREYSKRKGQNDTVYKPTRWNGGLTNQKRSGVRDNKGVYNGGGGSNRNMVRYPSKKRSHKTWKTFYEMFPYYAEKDGWNGKTSSRYKGQQKQKKRK